MTGEVSATPDQLNKLLVVAGLQELNNGQIDQFRIYLELILKWNERVNLTAIRDQEGILNRHFVECIACAQRLPRKIASVLDFGSGAGFPGVPIAICRPELSVTLAESQMKKAAFLNEAVRELRLNAKVFGDRAESLDSTFDCVALRAVDRMADAVGLGAGLLSANGILVVMTTLATYQDTIQRAGARFKWSGPSSLPGSTQGVLIFGTRI